MLLGRGTSGVRCWSWCHSDPNPDKLQKEGRCMVVILCVLNVIYDLQATNIHTVSPMGTLLGAEEVRGPLCCCCPSPNKSCAPTTDAWGKQETLNWFHMCEYIIQSIQRPQIKTDVFQFFYWATKSEASKSWFFMLLYLRDVAILIQALLM